MSCPLCRQQIKPLLETYFPEEFSQTPPRGDYGRRTSAAAGGQVVLDGERRRDVDELDALVGDCGGVPLHDGLAPPASPQGETSA